MPRRPAANCSRSLVVMRGGRVQRLVGLPFWSLTQVHPSLHVPKPCVSSSVCSRSLGLYRANRPHISFIGRRGCKLQMLSFIEDCRVQKVSSKLKAQVAGVRFGRLLGLDEKEATFAYLHAVWACGNHPELALGVWSMCERAAGVWARAKRTLGPPRVRSGVRRVCRGWGIEPMGPAKTSVSRLQRRLKFKKIRNLI